jgi:hypothetical protein
MGKEMQRGCRKNKKEKKEKKESQIYCIMQGVYTAELRLLNVKASRLVSYTRQDRHPHFPFRM